MEINIMLLFEILGQKVYHEALLNGKIRSLEQKLSKIEESMKDKKDKNE